MEIDPDEIRPVSDTPPVRLTRTARVTRAIGIALGVVLIVALLGAALALLVLLVKFVWWLIVFSVAF